MRSCCDQAFDPSTHVTGSPGWAMAKSNAREWQKARDATVNLSIDGEGSVNVALGKPVQVSSAFVEDGQEYGGDKAVNGSKDGWDNRWVCAKEDESPWIEVDLQGTETIMIVHQYAKSVFIRRCLKQRVILLLHEQESSCFERYRSGWLLCPFLVTE